MKIVFDSKIFFYQKFGGPSRYYFNLFENLNLINECAYIVSPTYSNDYLKYSKFKKNILGINLPKVKFSNIIFEQINKFASKILINKIKPQILHTTDYFESSTDINKPLVVTVHDLIHEIFHKEFAKDKDYRPKKRILNLADHIICVSENTKKDLIKFYNIDPKKITVIYHGKSFLNIENNYKSKNQINLNFKYFLYIGSRKRYKNFFSMIDAFKENSQIYNDYKIICVGGGILLSSEKKRLNEKNIDQNKIIVFLSNNDNLLYNLYKNASALIYPSLYEGFGMPVIEAMSLGCPVICSNVSSLPEVYGNAALTFSPSSKNELIKSIEKIAFDDDYRKKNIELGYNQSKKFSWEKCAKETLSVYKKLI